MSLSEAVAHRTHVSIYLRSSSVTVQGLKHALANVTLAASFFLAALPSANQSGAGFANAIWIVGALIMGCFSLIRIAPKTAMVTMPAIAASAGMLVIPALMRPGAAASGLLALSGMALEVIGVALSQVARIYMGRSFGILPANRGIVSRGPFAIVRHPIYLGWLLLTIGFACSYPSARNAILIGASIPFLVWRIELEERHLTRDSAYCGYREHVRFRLWPGVI